MRTIDTAHTVFMDGGRGDGNVYYDLLESPHGNELLGVALHRKLRARPIPRVRSRIAHPRAVRRRVRLVGPEPEITACYPGRKWGNPQQRAARRNTRWLARNRNPYVVVVDVHDSTAPGPGYMVGGSRIPTLSIAAGLALGYSRYVIAPSPHDAFYTVNKNAISVENEVRSEQDYIRVADSLHERLKSLVSMSRDALLDNYRRSLGQVAFYRKVEIATRGENGGVADYIPELESIEGQPRFSPLALSDALRARFAVRSGANVFYSSWAHQNMSMERPSLGTHSITGEPRREYFGSMLVSVDHPIVEGDWTTFECME